jgi:AcrR family transcriptional regulator
MPAGGAVLEKRRSAERRSHAERRNEAEAALLKAAVQIVAERGLESLTLADVGEAAGYSRGLPAHYFGSKEGLEGALARHIVRNFGRGLGRTEKHALGFVRLLGVVGFYFDSSQKDTVYTRALFAILAEAVTNPRLRKHIAELNAHSVSYIAENIKAGIAAGDIRKAINIQATATLILSSLRGAVTQWLTAPESVDLRTLRNEYIGSLKRSLAP